MNPDMQTSPVILAIAAAVAWGFLYVQAWWIERKKRK